MGPIPRRGRKLTALLAVAAVVSLALSGCGSGKKVPQQTLRFKLASDSSTSLITRVPARPIATMPASLSGIILQLYSVQRVQPNAVEIVFALKVPESAAGSGTESSVATALSANHDEGNGLVQSVSGVSLLDPSNLKEYETFMSDPSNDSTCLCTVLSSQDFDAESTVTNYEVALVAAPPGTDATVSVVTGMGTFSNVPIT